MKNKLVTFMITLLIFSQNLVGFGGVVTDPTSYTYYAKEIKAMNDAIKTATDTLDEINKVNDALDSVNDVLNNTGEKIYNPTKKIQGMVRNIQRIQGKFESMMEGASNMGAERFFKNYHNVNEPLKDELFKEWKDKFEALFDNGQDEKYIKLNEEVAKAINSKNYKKYQLAVRNLNEYLKIKGIEQRALKKYALLAPVELYNDYFMNADTVKEREDKMERIQQLASQIETATDMIKQQQTTNQFLLEMLTVQQEQYEMQMKFFYAISLNLINEKSNTKYDLNEVVEKRKEYKDHDDAIEDKSEMSVDEYFDNLIKSSKSHKITDILEGK